MMGYHVPQAADPDYYPLTVMSRILASGQSSRLYKRVVDKDQWRFRLAAEHKSSFDPTLLTFTAQPRAGIAPAAVEKAVYDEFERMQKDLVEEKELQKAKNAVLAGFYRQMATINGQANTPRHLRGLFRRLQETARSSRSLQ